MPEERCVDLLYLACNRLEFTQETFTNLLATTDWRYVRELFVYDDGSVDGTREWLADNVGRAPAPARFVATRFGSPVTAMVHFIESAAAPILAKTDNDAMLPPAWLRQSLEVLDRHPDLTLLGIEAMYPHVDDPGLARSYTPAQFISGLGLYRRSAFRRSRPRAYHKWFGLEEWQVAQGAGLTRGWITPAIPVFLLDRFPTGPWKDYTDAYVRRGWQRSWPKYDPACTLWHWRWPPPVPPAPAVTPQARAGTEAAGDPPPFKVVILSGSAANLVPCVRAVLAHEPDLPPSHVVVVDDGAREQAEGQLPPLHWVPGVKPFVFARNANLGLRAAGTDVVLLNDDALLMSPRGFTQLSGQVRARAEVGLCSAAVRGVVGNPRQLASRPGPPLRLEPRSLAFVCVYIPQAVYAQLGPLDERFTGYGFEDNDYCARARAAGRRLAVWDGCVVDHSGELPSSYRTRPDLPDLYGENRQRFREKWGYDP